MDGITPRRQYRSYLKTLDPQVPKRTQRYWAQREREGNVRDQLDRPAEVVVNPGNFDQNEPEAVLPAVAEATFSGSDLPMEIVSSDDENLEDLIQTRDQEEAGFSDGSNTTSDGDDTPAETRELDNDLKDPMLDAAKCHAVKTTKIDCLLSILCYSLRHGLTAVAVEDLCKLLNTLLEDAVIPTSQYKFNNIFKSDLTVQVHYFCEKCKVPIATRTIFRQTGEQVDCPICKRSCNVGNMSESSFFVTLPVGDQIRLILENTENISDHLKLRFKEPDGVINDIYDGDLYKCLQNRGFLSDENNVSLSLSTDGARVFNTGKNTLWPIQLRLNELHPKIRFNQNNTILGGLWFGKSEPDMLLFLTPLMKEANELYHRGIQWRKDGEVVNTKVCIINGVFDSKAKPLVQSVKTHNGYWGCGYCYHPGVVFPGSSQCNYPLNDDVSLLSDMSARYTVSKIDRDEGVETDFLVVDRSDREIRRDMKAVEDMRNSGVRTNDIKGVKGMSPLIALEYCDLVQGFSVDYMHQTLLGATKFVTNLWFDSTSHGQDYYIASKLKLADSRLLSIAPPTSISRRPRTLLQRHDWKTNEYRSWLLYFSVPCLAGLLPNLYLNHHALLVSAIHTLLRTSITESDLEDATWQLLVYVVEFQLLYGKENMVFNVHLLLHVGKCVKVTGPLWACSAFSFESGNGLLVGLVKGTVGVASQIVKKYLSWRLIPKIITDYNVSDNVVKFCGNILSVRSCPVAAHQGNVTILGSARMMDLSEDETDALQAAEHILCNWSYERILKDGHKISVSWYSRRGKKSDDSAVKLSDGSYGVVQRTLKTDNIIRVLVRPLNLDHNRVVASHDQGGATCPHIKVCLPVAFDNTLRVFPVENISSKIISIKCNNQVYVCEFPNVYEKD